MIHSTAVVHSGARVDKEVEIGPYCVIGDGVELAAGNVIDSHVVIKGPTKIGRNNRIHSFSCIGDDPQDKKYSADKHSRLEIGEGNTIREYCTINRGTEEGGGITRLGNDNWIMAYVHIAHDCLVGDHTIFANNATLAGHVKIDDHVILGGFTGVHQFCHVGQYCFSAISSVIVKDVPPFLMVSGNTASPAGLNREGLKRHGFTSDQINLLRKAYKILYRTGNTVSQAIEQLESLEDEAGHIAMFIEFIRSSSRSLIR